MAGPPNGKRTGMALLRATGLDNQPHNGDHGGKKVSLGGTVMVARGALTR
jgi:hypothetical protein